MVRQLQLDGDGSTQIRTLGYVGAIDTEVIWMAHRCQFRLLQANHCWNVCCWNQSRIQYRATNLHWLVHMIVMAMHMYHHGPYWIAMGYQSSDQDLLVTKLLFRSCHGYHQHLFLVGIAIAIERTPGHKQNC